jgi:hypothetical protein
VPKNYRKPRFVENLKAVLTKDGLVSFECKVVGFPTPILRYRDIQVVSLCIYILHNKIPLD